MGVSVETGVVLWGDDTLPLQGVSSLEFYRFNGADYLFVGSEAMSAVTVFDVSGGGSVLVDRIDYSPASGTRTLSDLVLVPTSAGLGLLTLGRYDDNYGYYQVDPGGLLSDPADLSRVSGSFEYGYLGATAQFRQTHFLFAAKRGEPGLQVYQIDRGGNPVYRYTEQENAWRQLGDPTALHTLVIGSNRFLFVASGVENGIQGSRIQPDGGLTNRTRFLPVNGEEIAFSGITDMDSAEINGRHFLVVSAAGTDSLVVFRLDDRGRLKVIDDYIDTVQTRIADVQAMEIFELQDRVFVVAGGGDDGVSLFELTERGRLVHLETVADRFETTLQNISDLSVTVEGDVARVFVASPRDHGVTELRIDPTITGQVVRGGAVPDTLVGTSGDDIIWGNGRSDTIRGEAGDDRLIDGTGRDRLYGGPGADVFEFKADGRSDFIMDFEIGLDRIDLSDWDRLYHVSDIDIRPRENGAVIFVGDDIIRVTNPDGGPFDVTLFTQDTFIFG